MYWLFSLIFFCIYFSPQQSKRSFSLPPSLHTCSGPICWFLFECERCFDTPAHVLLCSMYKKLIDCCYSFWTVSFTLRFPTGFPANMMSSPSKFYTLAQQQLSIDSLTGAESRVTGWMALHKRVHPHRQTKTLFVINLHWHLKQVGEMFKRLHYEAWLTAAWCSCGERDIIPTCCARGNNSVVFCIFPKLSWQSGQTIFSYWYVTCSRHMEPIWAGGMSILSLIIIPQYNWF